MGRDSKKTINNFAQVDVKLHRGVLSNIVDMGNDIYEISITFKEKFSFVAGEYVWVVLDELKNTKELDRRAFSISSADGNVDEIKIIFRKSDSLFKKTLLAKSVGSKLSIYGPHGGAYKINKGHKEYVLLAGGVGIAPFFSIIRSAINSGDNQTHFSLIYNKNPKDNIYDNELAVINAQHSNINISINDGDLENEHIAKHINKHANYFVCGPQQYVYTAYDLLKQHNVNRDDISFEQYYPEIDNQNEILELSNYINQVAAVKDLDKILEAQTSFYESIRRKFFVYLMGISIVGLVALLFFENYFDNMSLTAPENLVWWGYLTLQIVNWLYYYKYKKYTSSVLISINGLAITMVMFILIDSHSSLEKAWLMLPVGLLFFFASKKIAIINSLAYFAFFASLVWFSVDVSFGSNWTDDKSPIYWLLFVLNSTAAILLFYAVASLIRRSEYEMHTRVNAFNTLVRAVDDSSSHTIITDSNGIILYGNKAASDNTGFSVSDMVGQTPRLWGGLSSFEFYKDLWARKQTQVINNEELINRNKAGNAYSVNAHISIIRGRDNSTIGYIASEENISSLKNIEQTLRFAKKRTENIINGTELGTWEWNIQTGETIFNKRWAQIIGYTLDELAPTSIKTWEKYAHPDDLKGSDEALKKHFAKKTDFYEYKSRMKHKNGQWIWVLDRGRVMTWTPDGKPEWMFGSHMDITAEEEVDQAKSEFVSLALHQLRTPLSSINWYSELLLSGDAGKLNKQQQEYMNEVDRANSRMVGLVNSLLNVSRLELGTFVLDSEKLNPKDCAEQILIEIKTKSDEKKQKLDIVFDPKTPEIIFDKKYLEMLYQNLLSNAVKYTPEKGKIELTVRAAKTGEVIDGYKIPKAGIIITVADNGYGIPKNQQDKIMTKLFRADNALDKDADGTGLGLYIIKSVIDHSNGNLWFKSVENKGTTFHAYLPLETAKKEGTKKLS